MLDTWHFDPYRKGRLQYAHQCRLAVVAFPVELHKILVRVCTVEEALRDARHHLTLQLFLGEKVVQHRLDLRAFVSEVFIARGCGKIELLCEHVAALDLA